MKFNHDDPAALAGAAANVLRTHPFLIIATSDTSAQPWAVPVHQITLRDGRLTWRSSKLARHSQNIHNNPKTSGTLFSATADNGEVSLFIEGVTAPIEDVTDLAAVLDERAQGDHSKRVPDAELLGDNEYRIYSFTPVTIWINDDSHIKTPVDTSLLLTNLKQA